MTKIWCALVRSLVLENQPTKKNPPNNFKSKESRKSADRRCSLFSVYGEIKWETLNQAEECVAMCVQLIQFIIECEELYTARNKLKHIYYISCTCVSVWLYLYIAYMHCVMWELYWLMDEATAITITTTKTPKIWMEVTYLICNVSLNDHNRNFGLVLELT